MLKLRLCFRVMIWQPFAFYILPFSVNPSKSPFHPPIRKLLILKLTSSFFFFMKIRTTLQNISLICKFLPFFLRVIPVSVLARHSQGYERACGRDGMPVWQGRRAYPSTLRACAKHLAGIRKTPCGHTQNSLSVYAKRIAL